MPSLDQAARETQALKAQAEAARGRQVTAQAQRLSAQAELAAAQAALAAEFPEVTSPEAGKALLAQMETQVAAELSSVRQLLAQAGG